MTYDIRKTNGVRLVELDNEIIDTETISGIGLIGRLSANYGETQSNNFVHLVENFSSITPPEKPLKGQLWYKLETTGDGSLYICVNDQEGVDEDTAWKKLPLVLISSNEPENRTFLTGDMWYDTKEHAFKMYDSILNKWLIVGPENYNNTASIIKEKELNNESSSAEMEIFELPSKVGGYMFTCRVIGKEVPTVNSDDMNSSGLYGCIIKFMVNSYKNNGSWKYEIIEEPDYEIIGTNTSGWYSEALINSNKVQIKVSGITDKIIKWICKADIVKVEK